MATEERAGRPGWRPSHPGAILREDILPALDMPMAAFAAHIGISRQSLYDIIGERRSVTADVAARLGRAFGNSTMFWLNLQAAHDAWQAERQPAIKKIERLSA